MKISLITEIFAFTSKFPFRFLYLVSKSKKLQMIIKEILSYINMDNNFFSEKTLKYINNYKLAQRIYLPLIEKIIERKSLSYKFDFPELKILSNINSKDDYEKVAYNNLKEELYEKYNSLKIYVNDEKYKNRNNKWFFAKISEIDNEYFNNCVFMVDDIESIQIVIYLLYYNNYLNFKNNLKVKRINEEDEIKLILGDVNIKYILEYPRAIILKQKFIYELINSNINFYICSFENRNRLYSIIYEKKNKSRNLIIYEKKLKNMDIIINKPNLSLKEIDLYLKEYQSINAETLEFKNFLIETSLYDYFMGSSKYNKSNINIKNVFNSNKNYNLFKKSIHNSDLIKLNFEKDFFEIDVDDEIKIYHCSELINLINSSKHLINLYLYNFPLSYLKRIMNPLIKFISIDNFFNFDNDITFYCDKINQRLPYLKKINIKFSNYEDSKEFTFIKRNNINLEDIKLNLIESKLIITSVFNDVNLNKIYSYIESFEGINKFIFGQIELKLDDKKNNDNSSKFILTDSNYELMDSNKIKEVDVNILKYINYDNLLIYGHILNGIKPIKYYIVDKKNNNNAFIEDFNLFEDNNIFDIINKSINNFSEKSFSLIFKKDYFLFPFIQNLIIKIPLKKLQKFLSNCIFGEEVNLYNINIDSLYNIKNENIKNLNIYSLKDRNGFNNVEFNLRFIYHNIPSLNKISINCFSDSIIFGKKILPFLCFKLEYKSDINNNIINRNKNILILHFGDNKEILSKLNYRNKFNFHSKDDIIFKFNDDELIISKDKRIINPLKIKKDIMKIFIYIYILTLFIILEIIFLSNIF